RAANLDGSREEQRTLAMRCPATYDGANLRHSPGQGRGDWPIRRMSMWPRLRETKAMRWTIVTMAVGIVLIGCGPALAQERLGLGGPAMGGTGLLMNPTVQRELNLDGEQRGQAAALATDLKD